MRFGNIFISSLLSFVVLSVSLPAHAGLPNWCQRFLAKVSGRPVLTAEQRRHFKPRYAMYVNGKVRASAVPVSRVQSNTTSDNLFLDFGYWWFPGNIWHSLMMPHYHNLGTAYQEAYPSITPLTREDISQNWNSIRDELPANVALPEAPSVQEEDSKSETYSPEPDSSRNDSPAPVNDSQTDDSRSNSDNGSNYGGGTDSGSSYGGGYDSGASSDFSGGGGGSFE